MDEERKMTRDFLKVGVTKQRWPTKRKKNFKGLLLDLVFKQRTKGKEKKKILDLDFGGMMAFLKSGPLSPNLRENGATWCIYKGKSKRSNCQVYQCLVFMSGIFLYFLLLLVASRAGFDLVGGCNRRRTICTREQFWD